MGGRVPRRNLGRIAPESTKRSAKPSQPLRQLSERPPFDPPDQRVVGLAGRAIAENNIENPERSDHGIETILAVGPVPESVPERTPERRGERDAVRTGPPDDRRLLPTAGGRIPFRAGPNQRQIEVAVVLGRIGLDQRDGARPQATTERSVERPQRDRGVGAERRCDQVAPAGNGCLADLLGPQRPKRRGGVGAIAAAKVDRAIETGFVAEPEPGDQMPLPELAFLPARAGKNGRSSAMSLGLPATS